MKRGEDEGFLIFITHTHNLLMLARPVIFPQGRTPRFDIRLALLVYYGKCAILKSAVTGRFCFQVSRDTTRRQCFLLFLGGLRCFCWGAMPSRQNYACFGPRRRRRLLFLGEVRCFGRGVMLSRQNPRGDKGTPRESLKRAWGVPREP